MATLKVSPKKEGDFSEFDAPIILHNLDGKVLDSLVRLMKIAFLLQNMSLIQRVKDISEQIITKERISGVSFDDLIYAVDFLDIELLKAPLANVMIKEIHKECGGDRKSIEKAILELTISEECSALYWLNIGI